MKKKIEKIKTLFEALPYIKSFYKKAVVIKYGGSAMVKSDLKESFARDVVLMKYIGLNPIIVHGGGPQISAELKRIGKKPKFVNGIRVTDDETIKVVERVLTESVNKEIVTLINNFDGKALGLSGKDSGLIKAKPLKIRGEDMGHVGDVDKIKPSVIRSLYEGESIPVISPVGGLKGKSYNINADTVAGNLAEAIGAEKLILLTDVKGVLGKDKKLMNSLTLGGARSLISKGVVEGGMVPKVKCCIHAVSSGVHTAHIIDGRVEHAVLLEIFTDAGCGTIIQSGGRRKASA